MARDDYQRQLDTLRDDVLAMGEMVVSAYDDALAALESKDETLAAEIIDGDDRINDRYLELESDCIDLFALQQPVAGDLRFVASSFKIITDLERVERALREAALWDEVHDQLETSAMDLSGGQQQRLCIARAIAVDPEVVLMDEPASALDPIATSKIEDLIADLASEYTVVIVTHNMQQAARISDRTAVFLTGGALVEYDDTATVFENPADDRVEDYITGKFG